MKHSFNCVSIYLDSKLQLANEGMFWPVLKSFCLCCVRVCACTERGWVGQAPVPYNTLITGVLELCATPHSFFSLFISFSPALHILIHSCGSKSEVWRRQAQVHTHSHHVPLWVSHTLALFLQGTMPNFVSGNLIKSSSPGILVQRAKCECHQCVSWIT